MKRKITVGVTLLILLAVLLVLFVVYFVNIPGMTHKRARARHEVKELVVAVHAYNRECSVWPPDSSTNNLELVRALAGSNVKKLFFMELSESELENGYLDPWGNPYHCLVHATRITAWSNGPDGQNNKGKGDDIAHIVNTQQGN